jgi:HicA toxin of bacterial toxin-antitoxin,
MSQHEKPLERFRGRPSDFTWDELTRLLAGFGYKEPSGAGSRRRFARANGVTINLHRPHPGSILKAYQLREVLTHLKQEGHL